MALDYTTKSGDTWDLIAQQKSEQVPVFSFQTLEEQRKLLRRTFQCHS